MPDPVKVRTWKGEPITLAYDVFTPADTSKASVDTANGEGSAAAPPPVFMIQGFAQQMIAWDAAFCQMIADKLETKVIRFDNRDVGLSTKLDPPAPENYDMGDMADDVAGLIDTLGYGGAPVHVVGLSMGGFIVQELLLRHTSKIASAAIIMSGGTPANCPDPSPRVTATFSKPPAGTDVESLVAYRMSFWEVWVPEGAFTPELRAYAEAESREHAERASHPPGGLRQLMATYASRSCLAPLKELASPPPTVVIHGVDDDLMWPSDGKSVADAIRGAKWVPVDGMAHRILPQHFEQVANAIASTAAAAPPSKK